MAAQAKDANTIDESLYSRQLYVMGKEAQMKLSKANVLISGLSGAGVEAAKNIILAGVNKVVLNDDTVCTYADQGSQFYVTDDDVAAGRSRAEASRGQLQELNRYVDVSIHTGAVTAATLKIETRLRLNEACHANSIRFVAAEARGLFCGVFCDFGESHTITDTNGEQPMYRNVMAITKGNPGTCRVTDEAMHGLSDGDFVTFESINGMVELNDCEPRPIKVIDPFAFEIGDVSGFGEYTDTGGGGFVKEVKQSKTISHKPLAKAMAKPDIQHTDLGKFHHMTLLHAAFQALDKYAAANGGVMPAPGDAAAADAVVGLTEEVLAASGSSIAACNEMGKSMLGEDAVVDAAKTVRQLAYGASASLNPICAFVGGVVGQEISKACSGKFTPVSQFVYFDAAECLPTEWPLPAAEYAARGDRYDAQVAVFGREFQTRLAGSNMFLVGTGAIGCEMLKNWSLMGVATGIASDGDKACVYCTDMDTIEKSNLNRQFLFRPADVGKFKSERAALAATEMNRAFNCQAFQDKVSPESEGVFSDKFYAGLLGVCTALDNVQARLYVDGRCLEFGKPMFESGTLGTKANTQVCVPHVTESYGASRDPPEKSIPICTLKNFPNKIEHTIQWAREAFEGQFHSGPDDVNSFLERGGDFISSCEPNVREDTVRVIGTYLGDNRPVTFEQCIVWARHLFEDLFANQIKQLLFNFPADATTKSGTAFWSGTKRCPKPLVFNAADEWSYKFVEAAARLRAVCFGLKPQAQWADPAYVCSVLAKVVVPVFEPKSGVKIAANEKEAEAAAKEAKERADVEMAMDEETLLASLPDPKSLSGFRMEVVDFEKDDDTNFHMQFVTATSNMRARSYAIKEADVFNTKRIAGKIIPAIATTTAMATGLVCLQMYTYIAGKRDIESYRNYYVNLALPVFNGSEPMPVKKTASMLKGEKWEYTEWDRMVIPGKATELTLQELLDLMENEYKLDCSMVSCGTALCYFSFGSKEKMDERRKMSIKTMVETVTKSKIPPPEKQKYIALDLCLCDLETDEDIDWPPALILNQ